MKKNIFTTMICAAVFFAVVLFVSAPAFAAEPPGGDIIGVWVYHDPFTPMNEATRRVEFKADGSFNSYLYITGASGSGWLHYTFSDPGTFTDRGNYSVSENRIHLTNVLNTWKPKNPQMAMTANYTDKPSPDMIWEYEYLIGGGRSDAGLQYSEYDTLKITGWPSTGMERFYRPRTADGVELWPDILPGYLYPAGFNGVAKSSVSKHNMFDLANALGKNNDFTPKFTITLFGTAKAALDPYYDTLTANGFKNYFGSYWSCQKLFTLKIGVFFILLLSLADCMIPHYFYYCFQFTPLF